MPKEIGNINMLSGHLCRRNTTFCLRAPALIKALFHMIVDFGIQSILYIAHGIYLSARKD
jgi:hypothetical protein